MGAYYNATLEGAAKEADRVIGEFLALATEAGLSIDDAVRVLQDALEAQARKAGLTDAPVELVVHEAGILW
jgi:hypothetical protein